MRFYNLIFIGVLFSIISCNTKKKEVKEDMELQAGKESAISELIFGGDDKIIFFDYTNAKEGSMKINWELETGEIIGLPDSIYPKLIPVDDHKLSEDGTKLLISSSSGASVLIDKNTKDALFYANTPNAHSVEYLPNDRIAIVLSTFEGGNALEIYNASTSAVPIFRDSLHSGHGVTWNKERQTLFALGFDKLRAYKLRDWNSEDASLSFEKEWTLPAVGGHDLFDPGNGDLLISSEVEVWKFKIDEETFSPFDPIAKEEHVKSIYYNPENNELVFTKGEIEWYTHNAYLRNPDWKIEVPDMKLYKVRVVEK